MFKNIENNTILRIFYFGKSEIQKVIILSCFFSLCMVGVRVMYTGEFYVPYFISNALFRKIEWIESTPKFIMIFIAWLLFIPNSFYIITDLIHLEPRYVVPLWYDLALILSFVWNGLLLGILSVRQMEKILEIKWGRKSEMFFVYPVMLLNALGVYIGRYLRFNSWDVITNPFQLIQEIFLLLIHPLQNRFDWSMIICYSLFMTLIYITMKRLGKSVV